MAGELFDDARTKAYEWVGDEEDGTGFYRCGVVGWDGLGCGFCGEDVGEGVEVGDGGL